jgi:dolichol-phosphate mannosyltransferase
MTDSMKTLIFIPTYNERENAPAMGNALMKLGLDADLLFLDDNSPDGTGELLDELARQHARIRIIHRPEKAGIGSAHLEGIAYAYDHEYERLVTMDCDFTHSPEDVPRLLAESEGAAVVVGSRYLHRGGLPGWSVGRKLLTHLGHFLTKALLGFTQDATGALRVYDLRKVPRELFSLVSARGYAFFFESLFILHKNGFQVREVPIVLPARTYGSSKMNVREVERSVEQLVTLALGQYLHPAQFRLPPSLDNLNPTLVDSQGWDEYWDKKGTRTALAYDAIASSYRKLVIKRNLTATIRREFPPGATLLHAGCGSGQVDVDLHSHARITAVDISPHALRIYLRENPGVFAVCHANIFELPFPEATFDGAYNLGVVEHFTDEELTRVFKELHRVIKPGGKFVIFWPHARATSVMVLNTAHWAMNGLMQRPVRLHPPEVSLIRSKEDAKARLATGGFDLESYSFGVKDAYVQSVVVARRS